MSGWYIWLIIVVVADCKRNDVWQTGQSVRQSIHAQLAVLSFDRPYLFFLYVLCSFALACTYYLNITLANTIHRWWWWWCRNSKLKHWTKAELKICFLFTSNLLVFSKRNGWYFSWFYRFSDDPAIVLSVPSFGLQTRTCTGLAVWLLSMNAMAVHWSDAFYRRNRSAPPTVAISFNVSSSAVKFN